MSKTIRFSWLLTLFGALVGLSPLRADLLQYIQRPEPKFAWDKQGEKALPQVTVTDLHLVSQEWQGIVWEHHVRVFRPAKVEFPQTAILLVTGGHPSEEFETQATLAVTAAGMALAVLYEIPNQPLFDDLHEDGLIAYTFDRFLETGDGTWPLLFPMTKSAVKAMDALQAYSRQAWDQPLESFLVTGASKRGWTTWLTGAADPRVKAIMPMVYDNLNLAAQMPHQLELWGKFSPQIDDYTQRGLQQKLTTEQGRKLSAMVDPYTYRDRLKMPKLIINGTNDAYWTLDALNLYWDDLAGEKLVLYVPNAGHGLNDALRVLNTVVNFARLVAADRPRPQMTWRREQTADKLALTISSQPKPIAASLWVAHSDDRHFDQAKWVASDMLAKGDDFVGETPRPDKGFVAAFGEATYEIEGRRFTLSTQMSLMGVKGQ